MRTQSLNVLPLKPGVGEYIAIHATLTARGFFLAVIVSNKLHGILPKLSDKLLTFCNTRRRKKDTVLNRLHIGHSYFTCSFLLKKEEPPVCVACNTTITVKHILTECADLVEVRKKYFEERSLYSLFRNVNPQKFFVYLKEIGMFYKV